jgi:hypothetical protein
MNEGINIVYVTPVPVEIQDWKGLRYWLEGLLAAPPRPRRPE